jgi:hypothetical protein
MRGWLRRLRQSHLLCLMTLASVAVIAGLILGLSRWISDAAPVGQAVHVEEPPNELQLTRTVAASQAQDLPESPDVRLERLIVTKVEGDAPGDHQAWSNPSFQFYHGLSDDELREFRRDPGRVVERLLRSIAGQGDEDRRQKVLRALEIYLDEVEGPGQSRRFIARGVGMLASGTLPIRLETDLASAIARRSRSVGIEDADRAAFRERASIVLRLKLPHPDYAKVWALSLAQLGGREEKEVIVGAWDRLDANGRSKLLETELFGAKAP